MINSGTVTPSMFEGALVLEETQSTPVIESCGFRLRMRSLEQPGLQRQGVDRHRQQPILTALRPDVTDVDEVHLGPRPVPVVTDLRVALR